MFDNSNRRSRGRGGKRDFHERTSYQDDPNPQYGNPNKRRKLYGDNSSSDSSNRPYPHDTREYPPPPPPPAPPLFQGQRPPIYSGYHSPRYNGYREQRSHRQEFRRHPPYGRGGGGGLHYPPPPPPPLNDMGPNPHLTPPLQQQPRFRGDSRPPYTSPHGRSGSGASVPYNHSSHRNDNYYSRHPMSDRFSRKRRSRSNSHSPLGSSNRDNSDNSDYDDYESPVAYGRTREGTPHDRRLSPRTPNRSMMPAASDASCEKGSELVAQQRGKENLDYKEEVRIANFESKLIVTGDSVEAAYYAEAKSEENEKNVHEDMPPEPEPVLYGPALPKKEDLLQQIERIDREITKAQIEIETAKKLSLVKVEATLETPKRKNSTPAFMRNKAQQLYFENRERARKAIEMLEPLCCTQPPACEQEPCEMQIWKDNIETHNKLLPEMEKIIEAQVKLEINEVKQSVKQYFTMKGRWKESLKQYKRDPILQDILDKMNAQDDTVHLATRVLSHISGRYIKTLAVVPRMLTEEEQQFVYDDTNGFVEDPLLEWKEKRVIEQAWSQEEKEKFVHYLGQYQKDLKSVATHFPNKTMSDIIVFYYNNKRSDMFKKVMQALKRYPTKRRIYDEGKKSAPLPSELPRELRGLTNVSHPLGDNYLRPRSARARVQYDESDPVPFNEPQPAVEWSNAERQRFLELLPNHGRNFATIARYLKTKSSAQIKQFFNDNKESMNLELLLPKKKKPGQAKVGRPPKQLSVPPSVSPSASQPQLVIESTPTTPATNSLPVTQPPTALSENEDNDQKRGSLVRKTSKKTTSTWTNTEKDTFFNLLQEIGRNWKKFTEVISSKTEAQIKAFFQNYKVKLGLATEKGIKKKKKKQKYFAQEITAESVAPDLCNFASICEEISEKGELAIDELQASSFMSEDSLDEDGVDGYFKRKMPIAPPIRPRMVLGHPKLGTYFTRPTLKFNTLHLLMNETVEADSKRNISQHELANLELLGSLASEESNNANKTGRKNDRSRTTRTPNTPLLQNPVNTPVQPTANHSPLGQGQGNTKTTPEKAQSNVVDIQKQGKETAKTLKDKFFAGSTFTAHSSFYPIPQNFMLNPSRMPAAPYQTTPTPQPTIAPVTVAANSTIQQPSVKIPPQTNLASTPLSNSLQQRKEEFPVVNPILNRTSNVPNKEQLQAFDDNWQTTVSNSSRSALLSADSFGTPRNSKLPTAPSNASKASPQNNKDLCKPVDFNDNLPLAAFSSVLSSLPEPPSLLVNDSRMPKKNKNNTVSKPKVSVEALEEGSVNIASIHHMDMNLFAHQFMPTHPLPPITQDPGSSIVQQQQQQAPLNKSLFNKQ